MYKNLTPMVRVTHMPTGTTVTCECRNWKFKQAREKAIRILKSMIVAPKQNTEIVREYVADDNGWIMDPLNGDWL